MEKLYLVGEGLSVSGKLHGRKIGPEGTDADVKFPAHLGSSGKMVAKVRRGKADIKLEDGIISVESNDIEAEEPEIDADISENDNPECDSDNDSDIEIIISWEDEDQVSIDIDE
jgi:hypothetical protein